MATEVKVELGRVTDFGIHDSAYRQTIQQKGFQTNLRNTHLYTRKKKLYTDPNFFHLVKCFHFYPQYDDPCGSEQTASCGGASAPPQTSLVADNLLPAKHRPEMIKKKLKSQLNKDS